ncbi:hypothetical protein FPSE_05874 [Fusarium pseudograminearum CS3096]|uniref:Uncharacterized protein n=1 Tax=Fusarium pseudograminearum (strain CS3096) TaxID=1028729 RepID=K3VKI3_FUSPC|nr:hypothetical protein FPSE_05874 [Fusarium pseudograminearum CS3096]EKJ73913.1 hypothetical protein FPSE_05874 [Fusarium pseudograminearum CS3096]
MWLSAPLKITNIFTSIFTFTPTVMYAQRENSTSQRHDYESRNAELVELYMAAKRTGDGDAMMQVERLVMENSMATMERNFEISVPYQEEDVMWWEMD